MFGFFDFLFHLYAKKKTSRLISWIGYKIEAATKQNCQRKCYKSFLGLLFQTFFFQFWSISIIDQLYQDSFCTATTKTIVFSRCKLTTKLNAMRLNIQFSRFFFCFHLSKVFTISIQFTIPNNFVAFNLRHDIQNELKSKWMNYLKCIEEGGTSSV